MFEFTIRPDDASFLDLHGREFLLTTEHVRIADSSVREHHAP